MDGFIGAPVPVEQPQATELMWLIAFLTKPRHAGGALSEDTLRLLGDRRFFNYFAGMVQMHQRGQVPGAVLTWIDPIEVTGETSPLTVAFAVGPGPLPEFSHICGTMPGDWRLLRCDPCRQPQATAFADPALAAARYAAATLSGDEVHQRIIELLVDAQADFLRLDKALRDQVRLHLSRASRTDQFVIEALLAQPQPLDLLKVLMIFEMLMGVSAAVPLVRAFQAMRRSHIATG